MAFGTPVVKEATIGGVKVRIHSCPWPLYRRIYSSENGTAETLALVEEVAKACVEPVDGELDIVNAASRAQMSRIFELAVSDEGDAKPDF